MTRVVVFDTETTGKDRAVDQIIEICLQLTDDLGTTMHTQRIRPIVPIHPEATKVHGMTAEDLATAPLFTEAVGEFLPLLASADVIVGYNVVFDVDMLQAELTRAKLPPLDLAGKHVVDVLRLWHHVEPRTLAAAHQKFCGEPLVNAHQASADVAATERVLVAMRSAFGMADKTWPELAAIANPFAGREAWLGPSLHVQWDDKGDVIFGFGKNKGQRVDQTDAGFLRWVLDKDFPPHVKKICSVALERRLQFKEWITQYYPRAAAPATAQEELSL